MGAKLGGGLLMLAVLGLVIWLYGKARFNAGQLDSNVKWQQVVSKAKDERLKAYQDGVASVARSETTYHETVRDRIVPVTQTVIERTATYATTADGKLLCLPADRVRGLAETRSALFPGADARAADSGANAMPTDAPPRR